MMAQKTMTTIRLGGIKACVFDAYGTLFDVNSACAEAQDELGDNWRPLADLWRTKQLQYSWLRGLMGRHAGFWQVTGEALEYAMSSFNLVNPALHARLMDLYLHLHAYPEVKDMLLRLRAAGMKVAILSNGEPTMLAAAAGNSGITALFDAILSVELVGVFKPHPSVYQLPVDRFGFSPEQMCFLSSNAWDAHAAKAYGYRVLWCNRFAQLPEQIPDLPDGEIQTLAELPVVIGA